MYTGTFNSDPEMPMRSYAVTVRLRSSHSRPVFVADPATATSTIGGVLYTGMLRTLRPAQPRPYSVEVSYPDHLRYFQWW